MKLSGIYKIQSTLYPEKFYIGSAVNIKDRWRCHLKDFRKVRHGNSKLQNHYNKYEEKDLIFIILEICLPEFLLLREQYYIDSLTPWFNICKIAGSNLGVKYSTETIERMKAAHKDVSNETRSLMSKARIDYFKNNKHHMSGNHHSELTKEKMRKPHIDVTRKKGLKYNITKVKCSNCGESFNQNIYTRFHSKKCIL